MTIWVRLCSLGLALFFGQGLVHADTSALVVSSPTANPPGPGSQITMAWNPSPDTNVSGYDLCWGLVTGQCTNVINVGNVTNTGVGGLTTNINYCFTIVAYDKSAHLAPPSNEVQYMVTNLAVLAPPIIVTDVTNVVAAIGTSANFQVSASGGEPLRYQWLFNGVTVAGATNSLLSFNVVSSAQQGTYQAIVSNSAGSVTSSLAGLTVLAPPSITQNLTNRTVVAGMNVSFQVGAAGSFPLTYLWVFNGTTLAGATSNPLNLTSVGAGQAGNYQVIVTNSAGSTTSSVATLTVLVPPTITQNLTNQAVPAGGSVSFQLGLAGTAPFVYKWLFNGKNLPGATSNPLTLTSVGGAQTGNYQVIATNSAGAVTSAVAKLTLVVAPSITKNLTNETAPSGATVSFHLGVSGTAPLSYRWLFNGATLPGATSNPLTLSSIGSTQAGTYQAIVTNSAGSVTTAVASLTVLLPPTITQDLTNQTVSAGDTESFMLGIAGSSPFAFQWLFNGTKVSGATSNTLTVASARAGDAGTYQVIVTNSTGSITSSIARLTVLLAPTITQDLTNQTVAAGKSTTLQVGVAGTSPLGFQWLFNGVGVSAGNANLLILPSVTAAQAGTYQVVVTNSTGSVTSSIATLTVMVPPRIAQDITNQFVAVGTNVILAVAAEGSNPLAYQWRINGTNLSGATSNPLILSNITVASAGDYQVVVTNSAGTATSSVASVTVQPPLAISVDLTNQTVLAGSTVTFKIDTVGGPATVYHWRFNGTEISGATQSVLTLPSISLSQAGDYQVTACDGMGCVSSSIVVLDVRKPEPVSIQLTGASSVRISFVGIPGQTYLILGAPDVSSTWQLLATVVADKTGTISYDADTLAGLGLFRISPP